MLDNFKDVAETLRNRFAESPLGKQLEGMDFDNIDNTDDSSLDAYVSDVPDELCDDNGKQYRTKDGGWIQNNTYVLDEVTYKTDDSGNIYSIDGKRQSNTIYELNGNNQYSSSSFCFLRKAFIPTFVPMIPILSWIVKIKLVYYSRGKTSVTIMMRFAAIQLKKVTIGLNSGEMKGTHLDILIRLAK